MATDRRELILDRLRTILAAMPEFGSATPGLRVGRNRDDMTGAAAPSAVLHDGSEERLDLANGPRNSGVQIMLLSPQILILGGAPSETIGPLLSGLRNAVLKAVFGDAELAALRGANGQTIYQGGGVSTRSGERREGNLTIDISISYPLIQSELFAP